MGDAVAIVAGEDEKAVDKAMKLIKGKISEVAGDVWISAQQRIMRF